MLISNLRTMKVIYLVKLCDSSGHSCKRTSMSEENNIKSCFIFDIRKHEKKTIKNIFPCSTQSKPIRLCNVDHRYY